MDRPAATSATPAPTPSPIAGVPKEPVRSGRFSPWQDSVLKWLAGGGFSIVSLGFAAFTFLYNTLLGLRDAGDRAAQLRPKLKNAIYGTAVAVLLAAGLVILAFFAIGLDSLALGILSMFMAFSVLCVLCGVTIYIAADVYREGKNS